ncbi:hypothetical protein EDB19DRAFT_1691048 [Suillus lakei]|nr:hypothetical protein EDB19DRAFT_1691048 [Suillus lakei]
MGRRAKYLTLDDKMAALRQQKAAYSRTERGRAARQAQNARAYMKHHRKRGGPTVLTKSADSESPHPEPQPKPKSKPINAPRNTSLHPHQNAPASPNTLPFPKQIANPLPTTILKLASLPLPTSFLFLQALSGSPQINESDLPQWDKPPPYDSPIPPDTLDEAQFTRNLVDRVFETGMGMGIDGSEGLVEDVREAERRVMNCWDEDKLKVDIELSTRSGRVCERHRVMAECYWQWQARRICKYRQEADLLASGHNPYLQLCID